jgi:4-alpha-glucanotransferase
MTGLSDAAAVEEVVLRTHQLLAEAPSAVLVATLEDALAVAERPNMPNTTTEWPNWSLALPYPLEAIERHPHVQAVGTALQRGETSPE